MYFLIPTRLSRIIASIQGTRLEGTKLTRNYSCTLPLTRLSL